MGDVHDVAAVAENELAPWQAALDIRQPGVDANRLVAERCIEKQIAQARLNAADFDVAKHIPLSAGKEGQRVIVPNGKPVIDIAAAVIDILLRDGLLEVSQGVDGVSLKDIFVLVRAEHNRHVQAGFADSARQVNAAHLSGNLNIDNEQIDFRLVLDGLQYVLGG